MEPPRVTSSEVVYENRWMRVREDRLERADGSPGLYSVVEKRPAAVICPLHADGTVTLVEQWRHPVSARFWELPQGALDDSDRATPEETARTELAEETGLRAGSMELLTTMHFAYGISSQPFGAWLATDLEEGEQSLEAEEEGLVVGRFALGEVVQMIDDGRIADAATAAVIGLVERRTKD